MNFTIANTDLTQLTCDCLIVGLPADNTDAEHFAALNGADGWLDKLLADNALDLRRAKLNLLPAPSHLEARYVLIVGMGKETLSPGRFCSLVESVSHFMRERRFESVGCALNDINVEDRDSAWVLRQCVLCMESGHYRYTATLSKKNDDQPSGIEECQFVATEVENAAREIADAAGIAKGVAAARELGNLPPNICFPGYLADHARELADGAANVSIDVLDRAQMEELGMGALLAVAHGSVREPHLIVLQYNGAADDEKPIALVGKGITFDTGGISLKPGKGMDEMKFDMCGAAGVLGTFRSVVELGLKINLVALVPAVENMPDGNACRPGDVVTTMSGQTVEILNTDAEGRLILCDALTYAKKFEPRVIIDTATLTGACVVALGEHAAGLMTVREELAADMLRAGETIHDRAWRLPLWEEYQSQLDTPFADFSNLGGPGGGAITAGCYLWRFAKDQNWAHLDVAGVAWKQGGMKRNATGRPVGILTQYLIDQSRKA